MYKPVLWVAAICLAAGCGTLYTPAPAWQGEPEAAAIAALWLERSQGFDALEAWELRGLEQDFRFAVARKWEGARVKILAYAVAPELIKNAAYVAHLRPREPSEVWIRGPESMTQKNQPRITRARGTAAPPGSGAVSIAAEVVLPTLHGDFAYRRAPDASIRDEPCSVIESRPLDRQQRRGYDRLVYWISQRSGIALRKVYYRGTRELRRVDVLEADVSNVEGHLQVGRLVVRTGGGELAELTLHNSVADVELADGLFTEHNLKVRRFPRF
jgi:hypothetical protein